MPALPAYDLMAKYYPSGPMEAVGVLVGGEVESQILNYGWNSCCIRVSRCLNYGGDTIPAAGGEVANPYVGDNKVHTFKGGDKKRYIFSTYDLRAYLTARYKQPLQFPGTATAKDLGPIKGIILFHWLHSDLFDGTTDPPKCAGGNSAGYFGFPDVAKGQILVWPA